ncbi:hypothetical protein [Synechococcus sp. PCC 6312]|uniref:hypothetical protein n=1 Tax=Synechococcus sp. (strain ATCC 27167 / PCC 6312) TaxID=195253 RepID=UPI00029EF297|nr:hypothetical protein [Synechococcus sp. PCC 6312]AFY60522.1 hypothetical protein Syn6312_1350 [Synechococcus sp. PCC 6312]
MTWIYLVGTDQIPLIQDLSNSDQVLVVKDGRTKRILLSNFPASGGVGGDIEAEDIQGLVSFIQNTQLTANQITDLLNFIQSVNLSTSQITGLVNLIQSTTIPAGNIEGLVSIVQATPIEWQSKNTNFNAVANANYLINNTANQITVTLPSNPATGDTVRAILLGDQPVIFNRNSNKINGIELNGYTTIKFLIHELIFFDSQIGWVVTHSNRPNPQKLPLYNLLSYSPTALASYTYAGSNTLNLINDGNLTVGAVKNGGGTDFRIRLSFTNQVLINRITINTGQFNGNFNNPTSFQVYSGSSITGNPIFSSSLTKTTASQTFELLENSNFFSSFSDISVLFSGNADNTLPNQSVAEFRLFGQQL